MSDYRCPLSELKIEQHPNADRLELAKVGGYVCVVGKGTYQDGDRAVFIPAGSLLLPEMLDRLDETTKKYLGGSSHNRVRAARIRGIVSEGLLYCGTEIDDHPVGSDMSEHLGCVKYVPPIPTKMNGLVKGGPRVAYDIENIANHPDVLREGEQVVVTEKLHGTFCGLGWHPDEGAVVTSKGYGAKGLRFKVDAQENLHNLYCRAWFAHEPKVRDLAAQYPDVAVYVLGEIVGRKVQDLDYGSSEPQFRVFDIKIGNEFLGHHDMTRLASDLGFETVPVLCVGDWQQGLDEAHRSGATTTVGDHLREGCVVKPLQERRDDAWESVTGARPLGRVILKSVNPDYLVRGGGTEHQ